MKFKHLLFIACIASGTIISCDKNDDTDSLNANDTNFMVGASISNSAEIDAATLALTKSTTPQVMNFAQQMITEHSMAQMDLKTLGTSVGVQVKDTIDPAHVALKAQLSALAGRAFDSAYMHAQITDHQATINLFQMEQQNGSQSSVKNYANTYLPHIQMHLQSADSIANALF